MNKKGSVFGIIILVFVVVIVWVHIIGAILALTNTIRIGPEDPIPLAPRPVVGTYYCEELKMSIDFTTYNACYSEEADRVSCVTVYNDDLSEETYYLLKLWGSMFYIYETEEYRTNEIFMYGTYSYKNGVFFLIPDESAPYSFTLKEDEDVSLIDMEATMTSEKHNLSYSII